jgi:hypothetical protein
LKNYGSRKHFQEHFQPEIALIKWECQKRALGKKRNTRKCNYAGLDALNPDVLN